MRDSRLTVELTDDELVIRVGINTLMFAANHAPGPPLTWCDDETGEFMHFHVTDPVAFAVAVKRALKAEDEDGATVVHRLLDMASAAAIEDGALGVDDEPSIVSY